MAIATGTAILGAAALTAGAGIYGASQARGAASRQADAAGQASDVQRQMFERQVELQEPFREAGLAGQNRLLELLGIGGEKGAQGYGRYATADFTPEMFRQGMDPGYAFRMSEGMKALERSAAARGGLMSGATLKGITRFGQDAASQEYQNAFNRFQAQRAGTLNPYQALAGTAQSSANVLGQQAGAYGQQIGSNLIGAGNAMAAGQIGAANAISGGLGQGLNFYQQSQFLNRLPSYGSANMSAGPEPLGYMGGAGFN